MRPLVLAGSLCCVVAFAPAASPARRARVCRSLAFEARAPCPVEVAERLLQNGEASEGGGTWVAAFAVEGASLTLDSLAPGENTLDIIRNSMAPSARGVAVSPVERPPAAVSRLRRLDGGAMMIDCVRSSIEKEKPSSSRRSRCAKALVAEALKLCSADATDGVPFGGSGPGRHPHGVFEQAGFEEVVEVDFSVLGAGGPIPTHRARLAAPWRPEARGLRAGGPTDGRLAAAGRSWLAPSSARRPPPPALPGGQAAGRSWRRASFDASRRGVSEARARFRCWIERRNLLDGSVGATLRGAAARRPHP